MAKVYTCDEAIESAEWGEQIQLADSVSGVLKGRFNKNSNRLIKQRDWQKPLKRKFELLAKFMSDKIELKPHEQVNLTNPYFYDHYGQSLDTFLKQVSRSCAEVKEAEAIIRSDIREFFKNGYSSDAIRLRLQGGACENDDSQPHVDYITLAGVRYAGSTLLEVHDDDYVIKNKSDNIVLKDRARVFAMNIGDVWKHRSPPFWLFKFLSSHKGAGHYKGKSSGQPGLVLTAQ